jgi:hypothetical protein
MKIIIYTQLKESRNKKNTLICLRMMKLQRLSGQITATEAEQMKAGKSHLVIVSLYLRLIRSQIVCIAKILQIEQKKTKIIKTLNSKIRIL